MANLHFEHSKGLFPSEYTIARDVRGRAASSKNTVLILLLLSGGLAYSVLIYQLGRQSAQRTNAIAYSGFVPHTVSREGKAAFSVHKQSASLIAIHLQRFAETLVNLTERRILENMAVHLSARISALARAIG